MTTKTLLLDVDGVVADCATQIHKFAQNLLGRQVPTPDAWEHYDFTQSLKLSEQEEEMFFAAAKHAYFPRLIELYPGAFTQVQALKRRYDIAFVTSPWSGNPIWQFARTCLLDEFELPVIHIDKDQKYRIRGDVLVDDRPETLERGGGSWHGILFSQPWNRHSSYPHRISSLDELLDERRICRTAA